jgi:hypothetical protein
MSSREMGNSGAIVRRLNARTMLAGGEVLEEFHTKWFVEPSRRAREQQGGGRETVARLGPLKALRTGSCDDGGGINCMTHPKIARRLEVPAFDTDPKLPKAGD